MSEGKPRVTWEVRKWAQKAKKKGRGGDTDIVHVNEREKKILKALGGADTINPHTGLKEYKYGGAGVSEGMNSREGTFSGGGLGGGGTGQGSVGGMPKSLLDSKYPGSSKKKSKSADLSLKNVGTLVGKIMDLTNPAMAGLKMGVEAATGIDMPTFDDSFEGMGPDVPSVGAGFADSGRKDDTVTGLVASKKKRTTKPTSPFGSIGTILGTVGGSIRAGGL